MTPKFLLVVTVASFLLEISDATCADGVLEAGVSEQEIQIILDAHNLIRSLVACGKVPNQPRGINLKLMKYSKELEQKAQEIADKCQFKTSQITGTPFDYVGQNTFLSFSTALVYGSDWNATITDCFDKHRSYSFGPIRPGMAGPGMYTQLVWADTEYVGCGYTHYLDKSAQFPYNKLYVCAYGPGGNIIGETPYQVQNGGPGGCWPLTL